MDRAGRWAMGSAGHVTCHQEAASLTGDVGGEEGLRHVRRALHAHEVRFAFGLQDHILGGDVAVDDVEPVQTREGLDDRRNHCGE